MANKWMRKLGMGMSVIVTVSQLSGMSVFAASDTDFNDSLEEKYENESYAEEDVSEDENIYNDTSSDMSLSDSSDEEYEDNENLMSTDSPIPENANKIPGTVYVDNITTTGAAFHLSLDKEYDVYSTVIYIKEESALWSDNPYGQKFFPEGSKIQNDTFDFSEKTYCQANKTYEYYYVFVYKKDGTYVYSYSDINKFKTIAETEAGETSDTVFDIKDNDTLWEYIKMDPARPGILMADVELSDTSITKNRVLDLNSHTWNITWFLSISTPNTFKVIDSSEEKTGKINGSITLMRDPNLKEGYATLTLDGGSINTINNNYGEVIIEEGTIQKSLSQGDGVLRIGEKACINGDVTITGGEVDILGGEIKGSFTVYNFMTDTYINGDINKLNNCSSVSLSSGYYTSRKEDVMNYVADGYEVEEVSVQHNGTTYNSHIKVAMDDWLSDYNYSLNGTEIHILSSKGTIEDKTIRIPAKASVQDKEYRVVLDAGYVEGNFYGKSIWDADKCQTAHCGRRKMRIVFGDFAAEPRNDFGGRRMLAA